MIKGIIGRKVGMTQIFDEVGTAIPVTVIKAGPCWVTQIKTEDNDGYTAVQLGFEEIAVSLSLFLDARFRKIMTVTLSY